MKDLECDGNNGGLSLIGEYQDKCWNQSVTFSCANKRFKLYLVNSRQTVEVLKQNLAQADLFFKI